ncbi:hypothetical protein Pmani_003468 [Petrolisthes manimaculis]|uniref:Uncharacterized protein n=1 Tax=Petrolisthes manimaculis TaxID=1843537 RepID=A0AAE1QII0_9EUCA|nr:hypothetical protein Pmani_003468 [Petrolisthes manimaculis]
MAWTVMLMRPPLITGDDRAGAHSGFGGNCCGLLADGVVHDAHQAARGFVRDKQEKTNFYAKKISSRT